METETRAVVVDLVHIEAVEREDAERELEALEVEGHEVEDHDRSEARSASRTASVVAPSPPDPDYFVG